MKNLKIEIQRLQKGYNFVINNENDYLKKLKKEA
jgi:hypothetical protein